MVKKQFTKSNVKKALILLILIVIIGMGAFFGAEIWKYTHVSPVTAKQLQEADIKDYKNLMIVAHPDDEVIWGGAHLLDEKYFVLCITNGDNETRSKEFYEVMKAAGCKGLILSYPDKILNFRSDWRINKKNIQEDIATVLQYQNWDKVVTHNKKGEYGHEQHKMVHKLTTSAFEETSQQGRLFFFGDYYTVFSEPLDLQRVGDNLYQEKRELANIYQSQRKTVKMLYHMLKYENWTEQTK